MNRKGKVICALLLVQLLAWGVFVPTADAGGLKRLSAQFRRFAVDSDSTTAGASSTPGAGGIQVYSKSFTIPAPKAGQQAVVFITMTGTAEQFAGTFVEFSCTVDSSFCNGGGNAAGTAGWVTLMTDLEGSVQVYGVQYTWCAKVSSGAHTATVRMASTNGTNGVFLHNAHFFIDRTELKTSTADDCELGAP